MATEESKMLKSFLEKKENELKEARAKVDACKTLEEAKTLGETIRSLENEISKTKVAIAEEEKREKNPEVDPKTVVRKGSFEVNPQEKESGDVLDSKEYREAFAYYVRTGEWKFEKRGTDAFVGTADIGKVIPNTIMQEFIKDIKAYGQLFEKVRKINVKGGVEYPIEDLVPTVAWISETERSDTQKAPELKTSVAFGYHIAEARIAQTLLSEVVSLTVLESEIAKILAEAFVREFDYIIVNGSGSGQPTGILNDTRVKDANKITFSSTDIVDWTQWKKKLFAKVPLVLRNRGIFVMTASTWESQIGTLKDSANRPLYVEVFNAQSGNVECRFNSKQVILVEDDVIKSYDAASAGDAFAIFFDPQQYVINSNLKLGFKRWFDDDKNKWINKGLCVIDGKLLSTQGCFILKKGAEPEPEEEEEEDVTP